MQTKACSKCKEEKPVEAFAKDKSRKDGKTVYCKDCHGLYRKNNKKKIAETKKHCYLAKKDYYLNYQKQYREDNPDKVSAIKKQCYENKKDQYLKTHKVYRQANKLRRNAWERKRSRTDVHYRIKNILRKRLVNALKQHYKSGSAVRDLGCSIEFLKENIARQFYTDENGVAMSWHNWGTVWELDHHYPLDAANLEDRTEFLVVNNWRNLQPLTCAENSKKSNTVTPTAQRLFDSLCHELGTQEKHS
ncbi:MAG: hypothetical protein ACR2NF_09215 [Pirellulales bacterium]